MKPRGDECPSGKGTVIIRVRRGRELLITAGLPPHEMCRRLRKCWLLKQFPCLRFPCPTPALWLQLQFQLLIYQGMCDVQSRTKQRWFCFSWLDCHLLTDPKLGQVPLCGGHMVSVWWLLAVLWVWYHSGTWLTQTQHSNQPQFGPLLEG